MDTWGASTFFAQVFLIVLVETKVTQLDVNPGLCLVLDCWLLFTSKVLVALGVEKNFDIWGNAIFHKGSSGESSRNVEWGSSSSPWNLAAVVLLLFYLSSCKWCGRWFWRDPKSLRGGWSRKSRGCLVSGPGPASRGKPGTVHPLSWAQLVI